MHYTVGNTCSSLRLHLLSHFRIAHSKSRNVHSLALNVPPSLLNAGARQARCGRAEYGLPALQLVVFGEIHLKNVHSLRRNVHSLRRNVQCTEKNHCTRQFTVLKRALHCREYFLFTTCIPAFKLQNCAFKEPKRAFSCAKRPPEPPKRGSTSSTLRACRIWASRAPTRRYWRDTPQKRAFTEEKRAFH